MILSSPTRRRRTRSSGASVSAGSHIIRQLSVKLRTTRLTIVRSTRELRESRVSLTGARNELRMQLQAMHEFASTALLRVRGGPTRPVRPDDPNVLDRTAAALDRERPGGSALARSVALRAHAAGLTAREREVMHLVVTGTTSKQIAAALGLSVRTVDGYRGRIFQKMGVPSAARLIATVLAPP